MTVKYGCCYEVNFQGCQFQEAELRRIVRDEVYDGWFSIEWLLE